MSKVERPMPQDVAQLVTAARDGDREAFDELVRVTYAESFTLALRLTGNEEDARDVVQEAYIRAFRGLSRFRGDAQFSTWMYRITANCANTHLVRRTKHRHELLDEADPVADERPSGDPQAQNDASALRQRLTAALEVLPPKLRQVVVLRDIYDLPHEAIAAELGISETAAKVRLHRARKKLRENLFPPRDEEAADAV